MSSDFSNWDDADGEGEYGEEGEYYGPEEGEYGEAAETQEEEQLEEEQQEQQQEGEDEAGADGDYDGDEYAEEEYADGGGEGEEGEEYGEDEGEGEYAQADEYVDGDAGDDAYGDSAYDGVADDDNDADAAAAVSAAAVVRSSTALDEARRKALQGRFNVAGGNGTAANSSASRPSAFAATTSSFAAPTGSGSAAFSGFGSPNTFGSAASKSSWSTPAAGITSAFGSTHRDASSSGSAFGAHTAASVPIAAQNKSQPTATHQAANASEQPRQSKREKRESKKKEKKDAAAALSASTSLDTGMDSSKDSLMSRSKRFSNVPSTAAQLNGADPPSFRGGVVSSPSPSPSSSPPAFIGGRSTASMMALAMGEVMPGDDDGEIFSASNFRAIVGQCNLMCPLEEQSARQESRDLAYFEIIPGTGSREHGDVPLCDPKKAVKKYKRAAAAQTLNPKDVRPPHVLQQTLDYLITQIMDRTDSPDPPPLPSFLVIYRFISDRMRALRQDFNCQAQKDPKAIRAYEIMARFHILTMYELGDVNNIEKFDPTPNVEKLSQTLTSLRHMYLDNYTNPVSAPFPTPNEPEMHSYRLLIDLDRKFGTLYEELDKFDAAVKTSPIIQFCVEVYTAFRENNYIRFFHLARHAPYFHAVLLQTYFTKVRVRALSVMAAAYKTFPFEEFQSALAFEDKRHAMKFLQYHGIEHDEESGPTIHFSREAFYQPATHFAFRNSHAIIAQKRPTKVSQAVLTQIGRGEGIGLEQFISRSRLTAPANPQLRTRTSTTSTSANTHKPIANAFAPTAFGASAFVAIAPSSSPSLFGSGLPAVSSLTSSQVAAPAPLLHSTHTGKLTRPTTSETAAGTSANALNPNAKPFVPNFTNTTTTANKPPTDTLNRASHPVAPPPTMNPTTANSHTALPAASSWSASGFGLTSTSAPAVVKLPVAPTPVTASATPSESAKLPPPSFGIFANTTNQSTTQLGGSSAPPSFTGFSQPPAAAPVPLPASTLVAHISGFQLPQPSASTIKPPTLPVTPQPISSTAPPSSQTVSFSTTPRTPIATTLHAPVRTPAITTTTATQPIPPVAPPATAPTKQTPARAPSPSPQEAQVMFLAALSHYKRTLLRSHLDGWIDLASSYRLRSLDSAARADRFFLTKWFLRWHKSYVDSAQFRERFELAQHRLHAPVSEVIRSPSKPTTMRVTDGSTPLKSIHTPSQLVSGVPTPTPTPRFVSIGFSGGSGLTSPFAKLARMGLLPSKARSTHMTDEDNEDEHEYYQQNEEEQQEDEGEEYADADDGDYAEEQDYVVDGDDMYDGDDGYVGSSGDVSAFLAAVAPQSTSSFQSPSKSGVKRSHMDAACPSPFATPNRLYDPLSDATDEKEPQRPKLFHTPSRLAPRAVFSPATHQSSNDLLAQLKAELDQTSKLTEMMEQIENQLAY